MELLNLFSVVFLVSMLMVSPGPVSSKRTFKHDFINCRPGNIVQYKMTVHTLWSKETFPRMYPLYRPPAQWSTLVGRTHGPDYTMWEEGANATTPVRMFAEKGETKYLDADSKQGYSDVLDTFTAPAVPMGEGTTSVMVTLDGKHTQISFMMRIVPSPDWFIGLSSEDLCAHGRWQNQIIADLRPMDAGTDQGLTFTAPNWPHEPFQPISEITNLEPSHPASPFYYPEYEVLPRLAYVKLELLAQYRRRRTFSKIEDPERDETSTTSSNSLADANEGSTETDDAVANATTENTERMSSDEAERASSSFVERTTGYYKKHQGRDFNTGDYSSSTSTAKKSTQGKQFSTGSLEKGEVTTPYSASVPMIPRKAFKMARLGMMKALRPPAVSELQRKRGFANDGEPLNDVSAVSFADPQFVEVAAQRPPTSKPDSEVTHCEVTEWSEWTPCSQTCGFGKRLRFREVLSLPTNGAAHCPRLREESLCGSMRSCQWDHFSFLKKNGPKRRRHRSHRGHRRY